MTITKNKRILPIVLVIAVLVPLALNVLRSSALSSFDDNYRITDTIEATDYRANPCAPVNFNRNWLSFFLDSTTSQTQFISQANLDAGKQSLRNAIANQSAWGVSINTNKTTTPTWDVVTVFWSETGIPTVSFQADTTVLTQENNANRLSYVQYSIRGVINGTGSCAPLILNLNIKNTTAVTFSTKDTTPSSSVKNVFLGGVYNVNYPLLYGGIPIRQTYEPPDTLYPAFSYIQEVLLIKATYLYNVPLTEPQYADLRWRFVGKDSAGNYTDIIDEQVLPMHVTYQYQHSNQGDFELWLDIEPVPPTTVVPPDVAETQVQRIKLDGNIVSGNTSLNTCVGGVCEVADEYEDCSLTDVACTLRNFGLYLKSLFFYLFVPNAYFIQQYFAELSNFFNEKLGILLFPITFIVDLVNDIVAQATNTQCSFSTGGTIYGASPTIDLCAMENISPVFWNTFVLFARGSILFGMVFALRRKLISILKGGKE